MLVVTFVLLITRITEQFEDTVIHPRDMALKLENLITTGLANRATADCETLFRHMTIYNGILLYYALDVLDVPLQKKITYAFYTNIPTFLGFNVADNLNDSACLHWLPVLLNQTKELWRRSTERQTQRHT